MTTKTLETLPVTQSLSARLIRGTPVVGRVIREVEREIDNVFYLIVIFLTLVILAVQVWGLAALVLTAVALVPLIFVLLIWTTLP